MIVAVVLCLGNRTAVRHEIIFFFFCFAVVCVTDAVSPNITFNVYCVLAVKNHILLRWQR